MDRWLGSTVPGIGRNGGTDSLPPPPWSVPLWAVVPRLGLELGAAAPRGGVFRCSVDLGRHAPPGRTVVPLPMYMDG